MLKIEQIKSNVFRVRASTQQELGSTFVRFQEHYESPKFRNKIFTLGQFRDWYAKSNGSFSYYEEWSGFNIPSFVLDPFKQGLFDPLTSQEKWLLDKLKNKKEKFYLIGSNDNNLTLKHEMCHALYYINCSYRKEVLKILNKYEAGLRPVFTFVKQLGYHKSVLKDEVNSYITTSYDYLSRSGIIVDTNVRKELRDLNKEFTAAWK